jgi:hypothetical protein
MTIWLAIATIMIAATLLLAGCLAYILISLSRTAPLLGTRLGAAELQVIKVSAMPRARRRGRQQPAALRAQALPA